MAELSVAFVPVFFTASGFLNPSFTVFLFFFESDFS